MEGKLEAFFFFFIAWLLAAIFYNQVVKPYTPTSAQNWIGF